MRRAAAAAFALVLLTVTGACASPPLLSHTDLKPSPAKADARVAYGPEPSQFAELWLPAGAGPHPVVAIVHGGCWRAEVADLTIMNAAAADLRRRGYAVWNIEYRRIGESGGGYPGTYLDVGAALDALRREARPRGLDLSRLAALGHSAGGHLALWASARASLPTASPLRTADPLPVPAVLSVGGVGDLQDAARDLSFARACGEATFGQLIGGAPDPYADVSPSRLRAPGVRQVMLHGEREQIAPLALGRSYAAQAAARGETVAVIAVPGGHFEVITPGTAAWSRVVESLADLTRPKEPPRVPPAP
jgi:acetyl esterase/lipase